MSQPINVLLNAVPWEVVDAPNKGDGSLPYVTHHGVLTIADLRLRCYQLNDGRRIFDAEDMAGFLGALNFGERA